MANNKKKKTVSNKKVNNNNRTKVIAKSKGQKIARKIASVKKISSVSKGKVATKLTVLENKAELRKLKQAENAKKKINVSVQQPEVVKKAVDALLVNERAVDYLKRNVS